MAEYNVNSAYGFQATPYGLVLSSEFCSGNRLGIHLRTPQTFSSPSDIMNGIAPIQKGTTRGFINFSREGNGNIASVNGRYQVSPFVYETYAIKNDNITARREFSPGSSDIFQKRNVNLLLIFKNIEDGVTKLEEGQDVLISGLGINWLLI